MFYFNYKNRSVYAIFNEDNIHQHFYNDTGHRDSYAPDYRLNKKYKRTKRKEWRFYRHGVVKVDIK